MHHTHYILTYTNAEKSLIRSIDRANESKGEVCLFVTLLDGGSRWVVDIACNGNLASHQSAQKYTIEGSLKRASDKNIKWPHNGIRES